MTVVLPSVLCPVDFSEPSRSALTYAAAIADHFGARLTVLSVDDPLLAEVAASTGQIPSLADVTLHELERFCRETVTNYQAGPKKVEFRVNVGKPAVGILHEASAMHADLIVLSSHGRSGLRKLFFGSTTERVPSRNDGSRPRNAGRQADLDLAQRNREGTSIASSCRSI